VSVDRLRDVAARLLGESPAAWEFEPLNGGANNRVFLIRAAGRTAVLKEYFQHPDDPRDRLDSEYRFVSFAWSHDVNQVPRPLAVDREAGIAIYEHIAGLQLGPVDVTEAAVDQSAAFFDALNGHRDTAESQSLPLASEAYFSLADHLRGVEHRVSRLRAIEPAQAVDREAAAFTSRDLMTVWQRVAEDMQAGAARAGIPMDRALEQSARRLSPSDFGFHNALLEPSGRIRFVDFEYAGWDDPAKVVCDFFCQEAVPVPQRYFDRFADGIVRGLPDPELHRTRIGLLLPVYRVKWCCIMLNDFLPAAQARRRFTGHDAGEIARKSRQLQKARAAIGHLISV
jgi:hypothetical protein